MAITNIRPTPFAVAYRGVGPGDLEGEAAARAAADAALDVRQDATEAEILAARSGEASLDARVDAIAATATAAVPQTRTITGAVLATGGGDLTANRTITVEKANGAEAQAGVIDTKAVTPLALATPLGAIDAVMLALSQRVDDLYDLVATMLPPALIIVSYGQSLSVTRAPQVTTGVTIGNYYMPAGGDQYQYLDTFSGNDAHLLDWDEFASWAPFEESAGNQWDLPMIPSEGWGSGLGYQFRRNPEYGRMTFFCTGDGGRHWRDLRGQVAGRWANFISYIYKAHEWLIAQGELNIAVRFFWTQIEADCDTIGTGGSVDEQPITAAETVDLLEQLNILFHHDMSIIFDRDMSDVPFYVTPLNSAQYSDATLADPHPRRGSASRMAQAGQLAAAQANSRLILLPPHTQFWEDMDGDLVHLDGPGKRLYAELAASIAERVEAGFTYKPPHVLSATRSGATITATCYFPGGNGGTRDTVTFADPGQTHWADQKYGIQFWMASGFKTVSDATISGSTLTVTLAADPGAGAGELRVGQLPGPGTSAANTWVPRCNFRDATLSVTAEDSTVLYHYMMPQTVQVA